MQQDGTPPFIVDFLLAKYEAAMEAKNKETVEAHGRAPGKPALIDVKAELNRLAYFLNFTRKYMGEHRPSELFYPEANYGIKLSNGEMLMVSPPAPDVRGTMQESSYAPVTGARYVRELDHGNSHAITGRPKPVPKGMTDMTMPSAAVDKTQATGPKRYDE
jgi:hypothetical protein